MKLLISTAVALLCFIKSPQTDTTSKIIWNNDFVGEWVNDKKQKTMVSKCEIAYEEIGLLVQMWGDCQPTACNWGEKVLEEVEDGTQSFDLIWTSDFAESAITYEMVGEKLKMTHKRRYTDNSGREDMTFVEFFTKQ
ncbi:hypothetical protein [Flagellimonas flava]|uniref:Lipocalin-like domain-containing protein n=1 Tax=Flagellimonas flava TaxID=570519 RepID=A0A1M5IL06_9FLAO|nr:hypothetical protein [Allomuricauda flava]SHG28600.1 hypothetical protein SAMN04488116_0758 [Allomuricauda flava]